MDEKLKYEVIMDDIKTQIAEGVLVSGSKIPSEAELGEKYNVSRNTVRKAISELNNQGVIYTERGKGTFVSRPNIGYVKSNDKKPKLIGLMVAYINDTIFPRILNGIDQAIGESEYSIFWSCTRHDLNKEAECINNMIDHDVAGIIVEPTQSSIPNPNTYLYEKLESMGIPVLFIHGYYNNFCDDINYIVVDDIDGGYKAVKHLVDMGHENIGGIFKLDDMQGHKRYEGFIKGLKKSNLISNRNNVVWMDSSLENNMFDSKILTQRYFDRLSKCTAIVCYNDDVALALATGLEKHGVSIPDDLSIVAFDNNKLSDAYKTPFTSLTHPKEELGRMAASKMIEIISKPNMKVQKVMDAELILKKSVRRI